MNDYVLFLDTESSGLPKDWNKPYSAADNWPHSLQIAWIIYNQERQLVKQENYFIKEDDFKISKSATKVHGITHHFLKVNGQRRKVVLQLLAKDILDYQPLIVGHFIEFDLHMLGVDFFRTGIENPVKREMTFCTMVATKKMVKNPILKFYRLAQLYDLLFNKTFYNQHNALVDARATADCFFELVRRGEITDETITSQQQEVLSASNNKKKNEKGCILPVLFIIFLIFLIFCYL